jgi:RNA polymerase Rpc34 subunit
MFVYTRCNGIITAKCETAPSTEVTGGIWYTQTDFDHGFISSLSEFVRNTVREAGGATLDYILNKLRTSGVRCVYALCCVQCLRSCFMQ